MAMHMTKVRRFPRMPEGSGPPRRNSGGKQAGMMANYRQDFALKRTSKWMRRTGFARYGWDLNTDIGRW